MERMTSRTDENSVFPKSFPKDGVWIHRLRSRVGVGAMDFFFCGSLTALQPFGLSKG